MVDFIIFGGTGIQGKICARDLLENRYSVVLAGRNPERIKDLLKNKRAHFLKIDLRNKNEIYNAIINSNAKMVINCAELVFNIDIMNACLKAKINLTDLGGLQEVTKKQFSLDSKFKKKGIICLTGCGSTPGISNVLTAYAIKEFDSVERIDLGFAWNSNIKKFVIPYSIQSIFEEFTKPPIVYYNGKFHKSSRVRCQGTFNFKEIGKQTCYCIIHSEVYTFAKYFKKYGIKNINYYAGFPNYSLNFIQSLLKKGYYSTKPKIINGIKTTPLDHIINKLKNEKIPKNYKEKEDIWVRIYGRKENKFHKAKIDCIVKTLKGWEDAGSNIDTGRTISIISQMILNKKIKDKGVFAPEAVVPQIEFIRELTKRGMKIYINDRDYTKI